MRASACASTRKAEGGTGSPPPPEKNTTEGGGGGARKQPTATKPPANTTRGGQTPPRKAPKTGPPKRHRGTTQPKPATTSQEQRPTWKRGTETCRHTARKKKEPAAQPERKGMGGQGPQGPGQGHPAEKKNKKRKKHTPTTQPRKAGHSRDPGPARTPTLHARTGNGGGQAGHARNDTRPISRPKPNPNHEHRKQPTLEGQHHKPCPNTPTQDPRQDWRG